MKPAILVIACCLSVAVFAQPQQAGSFKPFTIDATVVSKLTKAKATSEFKNLKIHHAFWFFMDSLDIPEVIGNSSLSHFFDTLSIFSDVPCDCMIKNDTVYVKGGIAYGGGIGFDVRITGNQFNGKIWIAGAGYKLEKRADFQEEVVLSSTNQRLKIGNRKSLKLGKTLVGEVFLESERYLRKEEEKLNKLYMKILFSCKLDRHIVF